MRAVLANGQRIALRVARGATEHQYSGVVRSFDAARGLISVEMEGQTKAEMSSMPGREATIVGRSPGLDIDIPCIVTRESHFPLLVCQRANRRNHVRVNAFLQLKYRPVDREIYRSDPEGLLIRMREEMGAYESLFEDLVEEADEEILNPKLMSLLTEINRKLDRILTVLEREKDGTPQEGMPVNISGSGVRFTVRQRVGAKTVLAIRIILPLSSLVPVVLLGEVTRVRDKGRGEFEIAVRFVAIDELDRDRIVQYTFKRMRESVRSRGTKTVEN